MKIYSPTITGSIENTNIVTTTSITSLTALSASYAETSSYVLNAQSASFATTASHLLGQSPTSSYALTASYSDNFVVGNTLTAQTIVVQTITSSIEFNTGSTRNGSTTSNTHEFTGSVSMTGSLNVTGSLIVGIGGVSELNVQQTGVTLGNVITDTHRVTGSLSVSGSFQIQGVPTGTTETNILVADASGNIRSRSNLSLTGSTGPTGPTGPAGPTGPSGSFNANTTAGSAISLTSGNFISRVGGSGNYNTDFSNTPAGSVRHLGDDANSANNPGNTWWFIDNYRHSNASNLWGTQVAWGWEDNANRLATRNITGGSFGSWAYYLNSARSGTVGGDLTVNGGIINNNSSIGNIIQTISGQTGGMRMVTHSVTRVGSGRFLRINLGTNNWFSGFIYGYNGDNFPSNGASSTFSGQSLHFGGFSDGSGNCGDKYFESLSFGGNNVGGLAREMNADGTGYFLNATTSTGAGGFKATYTIFIYARDISKVSFQFY